MDCPRCSQKMMAIEYAYNHPEHYDGISEWACESCGVRIGRWSGKVLKDGEIEKRFGGVLCYP